MKQFLFYLEIVLTVLIGACGLFMVIAGVCYGNFIPIVLGVAAILMAVILGVTDERKC